jgi:hypothetical protein
MKAHSHKKSLRGKRERDGYGCVIAFCNDGGSFVSKTMTKLVFHRKENSNGGNQLKVK